MLTISVDQVIRYRTGPGATAPGLVVAIGEGRIQVEENFRFITPLRKWIDNADVVAVIPEVPFEPPE